MSENNTARLAREWAERIKSATVVNHGPAALAAAEHILATTDPLTMADTVWDEEEHALAGATVDLDGKFLDVAMLDKDVDSFITYATLDGEVDYVAGSAVTPNGKKYELREIGAPEQPEHPATLETLEDYENAPAATIVAQPGYSPLMKSHDGNWWRGGVERTNGVMAGTKRQVLRWEQGKDEETSEPTVSSNENVGPDQPEHPETLVTVEDYENAPEGTVVDIDETVAVRSADWWYRADFRGDHSSKYMAHLGEGDVIRWGGWGE